MRAVALCVVLVGCGSTERFGIPEPGKPEVEADESGAPLVPEDSGKDSAGSEVVDSGEPWPEEEEWSSPGLSLVWEGRVLADGDRLQVATAPAGIDEEQRLILVLTNRGSSERSLGGAPELWVEGELWTLAESPPETLDPEESVEIVLALNPLGATGARLAEARLQVPEGPTIHLEGQIPRPLRLVVTGDGGWTAISEDYGATFSDLVVPSSDSHDGGPLVWGNGRFFREDRSGQGWFTTGVWSWSEDGLTWNTSTFADEFWVGACAHGLSRFVCVRSDTISWSERGETIFHEATRWGQMLNRITFDGTRFVAVGRGGRRAWSVDGSSWGGETTHPAGIQYYGVALGTDLLGNSKLVAVGGTDGHTLSQSVDGGLTWADSELCSDRYATLTGVAFLNGIWLVTGFSNACPDHYLSLDGGETWSGFNLSGGSVRLLGVFGGWFFGAREPWGGTPQILRSDDGLNWTLVHTLPMALTPTGFAGEGR